MLEIKLDPNRPGQLLQCHVMSSSLIRPLRNANEQCFAEVNSEPSFTERGLLSFWGAEDEKNWRGLVTTDGTVCEI